MYAFNFQNKAFLPDGAAGFPTSQTDEHNKAVEASELAAIKAGCPRIFGYCKITGSPKTTFYTSDFGWSPGVVNTWLGTEIGLAMYGPKVRDNFGGYRRAVRMTTAQGIHYHGWYFESSGCYCRLKRCADRKVV